MRLPVVLLKVVRAGIVVDVRSKILRSTQELERRPGGLQERRQRVARFEASIVLGAVGEQCRPWGQESSEVGIIGNRGHVAGRLLRIAQILQAADAR